MKSMTLPDFDTANPVTSEFGPEKMPSQNAHTEAPSKKLKRSQCCGATVSRGEGRNQYLEQVEAAIAQMDSTKH